MDLQPLPPVAHSVFREAYGPIEDHVWQLARFRALFHALLTAIYAHGMGDMALLDESRLVLCYIASVS